MGFYIYVCKKVCDIEELKLRANVMVGNVEREKLILPTRVKV